MTHRLFTFRGSFLPPRSWKLGICTRESPSILPNLLRTTGEAMMSTRSLPWIFAIGGLLCTLSLDAGPFKGAKLNGAAIKGNVEKVRELLKAGLDPNQQALVSGETPLHYAARDGHAEVARALIEGGAYVDIRDAEGVTALLVAARFGHLNYAQVLVEAGADVNMADNSGNSPLMYAARDSNEFLVGLLLDAGARSDLRNAAGRRAIDLCTSPVIAGMIRNHSSSSQESAATASATHAGDTAGAPSANGPTLSLPWPNAVAHARQKCPNATESMLYVAGGRQFVVDIALEEIDSLLDYREFRRLGRSAIESVRGLCEDSHMLSKIVLSITAPGYEDREQPAATIHYSSPNALQREQFRFQNRAFSSNFRAQFNSDYKIDSYATPSDIIGNPFAFQSKRVALTLRFVTMESVDIGVFEAPAGKILVTGIEGNIFSRTGVPVLLAGEVIGKASAPGASERLSALKFLGAYLCVQSSCAELTSQ